MRQSLARHFYACPPFVSSQPGEHLRKLGSRSEGRSKLSLDSLSLFPRQKAFCHNKQHVFLSYLWLRAGEGEVSLVVIVEHINNHPSLQIIDQRTQRGLAVMEARRDASSTSSFTNSKQHVFSLPAVQVQRPRWFLLLQVRKVNFPNHRTWGLFWARAHVWRVFFIREEV